MKEGLQLPLPLWRSWPVGLRLRFKLDAMLRPRYAYLRGTPVLVLSPLRYVTRAGAWRQYIAAFGARHTEDQFGWALPEQLEPIPGESGDPGLQLGDRNVQRARVEPSHPLRPCRVL